MRIDAPGGATVELHRRCWIGRGGATPPAASESRHRASATTATSTSCSPKGMRRLQGRRRPRLPPRWAVAPGAGHPGHHRPDRAGCRTVDAAAAGALVDVTDVPPADHQPDLQREAARSPRCSRPPVRPVLISDGRQVGTVGMAVGAEHDRCVRHRDRPDRARRRRSASCSTTTQVDGAAGRRASTPTSDAELYRSPADIPVQLGVA